MRAGLLGAVTAVFLTAAVSTSLSVPLDGGSRKRGGEEGVPERLRDTGLYTLGRPFSPQYPLWTDGATKARWVYLPPGSTIDASEQDAWDFPVGTRFWKDFSFNGRKAETRMLWKAASDRWVTVSYIWNEDGSEALLAPAEGASTGVEVAPGKRHGIPSRDECLMCHGTRRTGPLGFNALQLSTDRDPNAIHGEPLAPGMVTLKTLADEGVLSPMRSDLVATPPRIRASDPATRAVLGYLSTNCGSCHDGRGEIAALAPVLRAPELVRDGDAVARSLLGQPTHWQVPGVREGASLFIDLEAPEKSALLVRMRSRRPSSQMPPLGTVVRDEQAVDAIKRWIDRQIVGSP